MRNPVYGQNLFHPHSKPLPPHTLFATRLVCPTTNQCRGEIFFARIANHYHRIPVRNPNRQPQHHLQRAGEIFFARIANHHHRIPCSQRDPSAPTSSANVRAKNISPRQHSADTHYHSNDPTKVPHTASHRRRAMCWGCAAAPAATPLSCQINLNHNWR